jgi:hypothetical protein
MVSQKVRAVTVVQQRRSSPRRATARLEALVALVQLL